MKKVARWILDFSVVDSLMGNITEKHHKSFSNSDFSPFELPTQTNAIYAKVFSI